MSQYTGKAQTMYRETSLFAQAFSVASISVLLAGTPIVGLAASSLGWEMHWMLLPIALGLFFGGVGLYDPWRPDGGGST